MFLHGVDIPVAALTSFCRKHHVAKLSLFGSILRDDFGPGSDVDVLVEFVPGTRVSLLDMGGMLIELQHMIGREVDLRTPEDLSPYFRETVKREAKLLYAA